MTIGYPTRALIIVDVQNDFLPGGALGVDHGDEVIQPIIDLARTASPDDPLYVVTTGDSHPADTKHFDKWPVHCVVDTEGAKVHPDIIKLSADHIVKGTSREDDGYSGFEGRDIVYDRTLDEIFAEFPNPITDVTVVGLALDYCVKATALDARKRGLNVTVPLAATRAVAPDTGEAAIRELREAGVTLLPNDPTWSAEIPTWIGGESQIECPTCGGKAPWHDEAWVCDTCGDEFYPTPNTNDAP